MAASDDHAPARKVPVTAEDMPVEVQCLLKSYDLKDIRWANPRQRHLIVVLILTRGWDASEQWLWSQCSREEVRNLLRRFHGIGSNEDRAILRQKMDLTEAEVPPRPFPGIPWPG